MGRENELQIPLEPLLVITPTHSFYFGNPKEAQPFINKHFPEDKVTIVYGEEMRQIIPSGATQPGQDGIREPITWPEEKQ